MKNNITLEDENLLTLSFISPKQIYSANIFRVDDIQGAEIVGHQPITNRNYSGLVFPYFLPEQSDRPREYQLRLDNPFDENRKYLFPKGTRNMLYFPPSVTNRDLSDISQMIVITEGVKKALALDNLATCGTDRKRFVSLAVVGVWSWKGKIAKDKKGIIPDFNMIEWNGRDVVIVFDADTKTNPKVRQARTELAKMLKERGARVFYVDVPQIEGEKCGIDDLLGLWQAETNTQSAVQKGLELLATKQLFKTDELSEVLFEGRLKLEATATERNKTNIIARNKQNEVLHIDSFNLSDSARRAKFAKALPFADENEQAEIARTLLKFADNVKSLRIDSVIHSTSEAVQKSFIGLKDGRIAEQIRTGFAIYDAETDTYSIEQSVIDSDGTIYQPVDDELLKMEIGGIFLADDLCEYESDEKLIEDISAYLNKFVDLKPLYLKLASYYILFTYIFDKFFELSYISATGDLGSGKSRFGNTIALASYRGYIMVSPTAATLYRVVDRFSPTLFIDEFNSSAKSDDTQAIIQVLNTGCSKLATISRQTKDNNGNFKTETFNPFCPKIIGSYKESASDALKSRNIEIQMERSYRNDLPIRLSNQLFDESRKIRNKLILWRLKNYKNDIEPKLIQAERELRQAGITPRSIQINIPLYALIKDKNLRQEFIELLKGRDDVLIEAKKQSLDGEIIQAIHSFIFEVEVDNDENVIGVKWLIEKPEDQSLCKDIIITNLTARLNNEREDKKNLMIQYIGRKLVELGLMTKKIWARNDRNLRGKNALVFDYQRLKILFDNYNLPYAEDFDVANVANVDKDNKANGLDVATSNSETEFLNSNVASGNIRNNNTYGNGDIGNINFTEMTEKKENRIHRSGVL